MSSSVNNLSPTSPVDCELLSYHPVEKPKVTSWGRIGLGVGVALLALTAIVATVALIIMFPPSAPVLALSSLGILGVKVAVGVTALGLMGLSAYYFSTCRLNALDPRSHS